jgi:thiol-disulfide isomerase/thioredoxin
VRAIALVLVPIMVVLAGCRSTPVDERPTEPSAPVATPTPTAAGPIGCPNKGLDAVKGAGAIPRIGLRCLGGADARWLNALAGQPTVINFWASWCGPCKVELPLLARAHREFGDEVAFIGIDVQDASGPAFTVLRRTGVTYGQLEDPKGETRAAFGWQSGLPMTVFVDARGRMVGTERTSFRTYPEVVAAIQHHLGVSLPKGTP